jgi:TetR/AcrR family transcriptional repressor of mexJK operon
VRGADADEVREELRPSLRVAGGDPVIAMQRVGEQLLRVLVSPAFVSLHRHAMAEADRFPEVGETFFARGPTVVYGAIAERLQHWEKLGVLRRPSAAEVRATVRRAVRTFLAAHRA